MQEFDKYLPIGTIILLKGINKKVMITGFCSKGNKNPNKIRDYSGCPYPEGILRFDQIMLFDHDQIASVVKLGYIDDEEQKFKQNLKLMLEKSNSSTNQNYNINNNIYYSPSNNQ